MRRVRGVAQTPRGSTTGAEWKVPKRFNSNRKALAPCWLACLVGNSTYVW